jgi:starch-binding outer membrane protein, SusD/RagB family
MNIKRPSPDSYWDASSIRQLIKIKNERMKKYRYKLSIAVVAIFGAMGLASCNGVLDSLGPHNVTTEDNLFSTTDGYQRAVEGVYSLSYNAWGDKLVFTGDADGNDLRDLETVVSATEDVFDYTHNLMDIWTPCYKLIQHTNLILRHATTSATDSVIKEARAEALFCRAYAYFNIARCYGRPYYQSPESNLGAILVTDPDDDGIRGRNTVKETYAQIINDLMGSIPFYTSNRGSSYASIYASEALLSRVYLYMGGIYSAPNAAYNDSVVKYATKVIASGVYSLAKDTSYTNYFKYQNTSSRAVEDIFDINITSLSTGSLLHGYYTPVSSTYAGIYAPSPYWLTLVNAESGDLRQKLLKTVKFTRSTFGDTKATIKYDVSGTSSTSRYSLSPIRHFRLIEMYLNRAEAYVKLGQDANALADLNVVRVRAGLTALSSGSLTGQSLFNAIFNQRQVELAFEGQNGFDYFRNGLTMKRSYTSSTVAGVTAITSVDPTDAKVVLRIPSDEITLNKYLEQNDQ